MLVAANLKDLCAKLKAMPKTDLTTDVNALRSMLTPDIQVVTEKTDSDNVRIIVSSHRVRADHSVQLVRECNGVIFEYPSWDVLAVPNPMFNPKYAITEVEKHIADYSIYEVYDGTMVVMYWYNGSWCFATANGYDVSNYKFFTEKTYREAINDCLQKYPEFSFDTLPKTHSYITGFRHHDFHPFKYDPARMWMVAAVDLTAFNQSGDVVYSYPECGIPYQPKMELPVLENGDLFTWMMASNESALKKFIGSLPKSKRNPTQPIAPHYGYVLRSNIDLGVNSNVILESAVMKTIRQMIYNVPKTRLSTVKIDHTNRLEYMILQAYLHPRSRYPFLTLFPQFDCYYMKYNTLFQKIANHVVSRIKGKPYVGGKNETIIDGNIQRIVIMITDHIKKCGTINVQQSDGRGIVTEFLMNTQYLDMYFTCVQSAYTQLGPVANE